MYDYKAPLRDHEFVYFELLDYESHLASLPKYKDMNRETWSAILEEYARFVENEIMPLYQVGDQGCEFDNGSVKTPPGFAEVYRKYQEAGWQAMGFDESLGGMGLPESLYIQTMELRGMNWAWNSLIGFGKAASPIFLKAATQDVRDMFLPKIISGEWLATMCLTEPHCGTDLGLLKTKATPNADGTYSLSGTKIFITAGEHDLSDNIIHVVLARIEGAPTGVEGISLFAVPKFLVDNGECGDRNGVSCGSIEHKMGIKGSATCVMNFDGATGYLLGEPNRGLPAMFPMMNLARIGTGQQGQCHAEFGLQQSLAYARERLQSRSLNGPKNPDDPADPIIVHPDVRRMLLTQKAFAEGGRMLIAYCGQLSDQLAASDDPAVIELANNKLSLLTPVVKAFLTEVGFESANLGMQCFGGHGYVKEWGVEQNVRDARISMLYEGTTGVQSLDLLGRKVLGSKLELLKGFTVEIQQFVEANAANPLVQKFMGYAKTLQDSTALVAERAMKDRDEIGAASVDYLMMVGYLALGYLWAQAALLAEKKLSEGTTETDFYQAKIKTATFYFDRILTRIETHAANIRSGAGNLMSIPEEQF